MIKVKVFELIGVNGKQDRLLVHSGYDYHSISEALRYTHNYLKEDHKLLFKEYFEVIYLDYDNAQLCCRFETPNGNTVYLDYVFYRQPVLPLADEIRQEIGTKE